MSNSLSISTENNKTQTKQLAIDPNQAPSLVIDLKKHRIRIHKHTLHLLGNPDFVLLYVNPSTQTIIIQCANSNDHLAHRIHWKTIAGKQCCELYSKYLMDTMSDVFMFLNQNSSYRISGILYEQYKLARFDLKDSVCLNQINSYEEINT